MVPAPVPSPTRPGDVVGLSLDLPGGTSPAGKPLILGQAFARGDVRPGDALVFRTDAGSFAVQVDAKTFHPDGSVEMAVLTLAAPGLGAGTSVPGMIAHAAAPAGAAAALDLGAALRGYALAADLTVHGAAGDAAFHLDLAGAMRKAIADGTASYWQGGPLATGARVDVPVSGSFHLTVDITATADGVVHAAIGFDNDRAMGAAGGTVRYAATVTENGTVVHRVADLTQYQYQNEHVTLHEDEAPAVNVRHDVAYLQSAGVIPDFDLSGGVSAGYLANAAATMAAPGWDAPLGANGIFQYMPNTGGRADIGPTTQANWAWLATGDATAAAYAKGQADAADGIPWHFRDAATGTWVSTDTRPDLWVDGRGGASGTTGLTQAVDTKNTGWTTDAAHQPDLSAIPYILTGDRHYLDELNAQAAYDVVSSWPVTRGDAADLLLPSNQIRGAAWSLREIGAAAQLNPDGSAEARYFAAVEAGNWAWLKAQLPAWTAVQGAAYGRLSESYGEHTAHGALMSPWQEDFFAVEAAAAALRGNADAKAFLEWQANWIVGRFLHAAEGFNPHDGINYSLPLRDAAGAVLDTWKEIGDATVAAGSSNGDGWAWSDGYYGQVAAAALAGVVTVTGSVDAMRAYDWLITSGAPYVTGGVDCQFDIAPRLPDGTLLTSDRVIVIPTVGGTLTGTAGSELLHGSAGDDVLVGAAGMDLLSGGGGRATLWGGAGDDVLFGGTGTTLLLGGAGNNRLDGGAGADVFAFRVGDAAHDTVSHYDGRSDTLRFLDESGADLGAAARAAILAGATADGAGNTVLHLSAAHDVTVLGTAPSGLVVGTGAAVVEPGAPSPPSPPPSPPLPPPPLPPAPPPPSGVTLTGTAGADTLDGASGAGLADTLAGGAGNDTYRVDSARDVVTELPGGGVDSVVVRVAGGGFTLPDNVENLVLEGTSAWGTGNALANSLSAGRVPGSQVLRGEGGDDVLLGGAGRDVLYGGAGRDTFVLTPGNRGEVVADFQPGADKLLFVGFFGMSFGRAMAATHDVGGSAVIDLGHGNSFELTGVAKAALSAGDFIW